MIKTIIKKIRAEYKKEYIKRYALQRNVHKIKVLKKVERKIKCERRLLTQKPPPADFALQAGAFFAFVQISQGS